MDLDDTPPLVLPSSWPCALCGAGILWRFDSTGGGGWVSLNADGSRHVPTGLGAPGPCRCGHPASWHRRSDSDPAFRCLGWDADRPDVIRPPGGRTCSCDEYQRPGT